MVRHHQSIGLLTISQKMASMLMKDVASAWPRSARAADVQSVQRKRSCSPHQKACAWFSSARGSGRQPQADRRELEAPCVLKDRPAKFTGPFVVVPWACWLARHPGGRAKLDNEPSPSSGRFARPSRFHCLLRLGWRFNHRDYHLNHLPMAGLSAKANAFRQC
jgi:hypothetical protein